MLHEKNSAWQRVEDIRWEEKTSRAFLKILTVILKVDLYGPSYYYIAIMQEQTT